MRKLQQLFILLVVALMATSCGGGNGGEQEIEVEQEQHYLYLEKNSNNEYEFEEDDECKEQIVDAEAARLAAIRALPWDETTLTPEAAAFYFARMEAAWDADGGEMWGVPLHAAIIFICIDTQIAIANRPSPRMALWTIEEEFVKYEVDGFGVYIGTHRPVTGYVFTRWGNYEGVFWSWWALQARYELREPPTFYQTHYL